RRRKPCVLARRRLFGWKVRLLTRFSVACGPVVEGRVDPESNRVVQLQGATALRPQSASPWTDTTADGPTSRPCREPHHGGARHGHAKEVADTLGQRYGSAGRGVKPVWAAGALPAKLPSSAVRGEMQLDTP